MPKSVKKRKKSSHTRKHITKLKMLKIQKQPKEYIMLVEACHTTILIIISVAHSKKSKWFFRLKTIGDPRWFPEELRQLIIIHDGVSINLQHKRLQQKNTEGIFIVLFLFTWRTPSRSNKPEELLVFRAYILLIQAILNFSYRSMPSAPLKIEHTVQ